MSEVKELTLQEVSEHNNKKDLYLIINDKVYDCTTFANEHPYVVSISTHCPRIQNPNTQSERTRARIEEEETKQENKNKKKRPPQPIIFTPVALLHQPQNQPQNQQANQSNSGGEEVLLDLAGQDCTEAFDDVGHSDEARALLDDGMFVGDVKRMVRNPPQNIPTSLLQIHLSPHTPCVPLLPSAPPNPTQSHVPITDNLSKIARRPRAQGQGNHQLRLLVFLLHLRLWHRSLRRHPRRWRYRIRRIQLPPGSTGSAAVNWPAVSRVFVFFAIR